MASGQSPVFSLPRSVPLSPDSQSAGIICSPWLRFTWNTSAIGTFPGEGGDLIRHATREEGEEVLRVILLSLSMDSAWNDSLASAEQYLKAEVGRIFNGEDPLCLVLPKGNRLIAVSLLDPSPEAASHLVGGPSVLMEYRNRGLGSRLLHASLAELGARGIPLASGITRGRTVAATHVYPKFGGSGESISFPSSKPVEAKA
jgi:GNAT superfamily N-acetyltransferase